MNCQHVRINAYIVVRKFLELGVALGDDGYFIVIAYPLLSSRNFSFGYSTCSSFMIIVLWFLVLNVLIFISKLD